MTTATVRPMRRADLPGVAALFEEWAGHGNTRPPGPAEEHFAALLLDHADDDLPSWVAEGANGELLGLMGVRALRVRSGGRTHRAAVGTNLIVAAAARGRGLGRELTGRWLAGPQDLTYMDDAADVTRRLCVGHGARVDTTRSIGWRRVLAPGAAAAASPWWARRPRPARAAVSVLAGPVDRVAAALPPVRARLAPPVPATRAEGLTPEALRERVAGPGLHPDHDPSFLAWLLDTLDEAGGLRRALVPEAGWYVMHVPTGGTAQVLGLGGGDPGAVLDHLLHAADAGGAVAVEGRLEPGLLEHLRHRRARLLPSTWTIVHAHDPALLAALAAPDARLTRLDGNWWNGYVVWR